MSKANLLINDDVWRVLPGIVKSAKRVDAAIAYFGTDGATLLPLKRGDRLIVDMSPAVVKAGSTNPNEIEKLIKRGVQVFSRQNLHAKIVVADDKVLVGSANVSKHSRDVLEEAAILTGDPIVLRRAKEFLDRICNEPPIGPKYLAVCKSIYKPPRFINNPAQLSKRKRRVSHAKLWLVNLVDSLPIPDSEIELFERSENSALKLLQDTTQFKLDTFNWLSRPKMADELERGDSIVQCIRHKDKSISVYPPARLISIGHYTRSQDGKQRYLFHLEYPLRGEKMNWDKFRKVLSLILSKQISRPRTMPIRDTQKADNVLRLWTPKGRVSKR